LLFAIRHYGIPRFAITLVSAIKPTIAVTALKAKPMARSPAGSAMLILLWKKCFFQNCMPGGWFPHAVANIG
jgi:hypothetical protein